MNKYIEDKMIQSDSNKRENCLNILLDVYSLVGNISNVEIC